MAHFAKIENNLVTQVVVVDNNDILDVDGNESEAIGAQFCTDLLGGTWIQTSYNASIRQNYAGIGDTYNTTGDYFIGPKPYPSWSLNETLYKWEAPSVEPIAPAGSTEQWVWDEDTISWIRVDEV